MERELHIRWCLHSCESRLEQAQGGENTSNPVLCKPHVITYSSVPPRVPWKEPHPSFPPCLGVAPPHMDAKQGGQLAILKGSAAFLLPQLSWLHLQGCIQRGWAGAEASLLLQDLSTYTLFPASCKPPSLHAQSLSPIPQFLSTAGCS